MCCSGKMLGPFGGNGGVEFDSGDFRAAGCHLGHISGKVRLIIIITLIKKYPWCCCRRAGGWTSSPCTGGVLGSNILKASRPIKMNRTAVAPPRAFFP